MEATCKECTRLMDIVGEAHQDGAELHMEIRSGAWAGGENEAEDAAALQKEKDGVEARLAKVTKDLKIHELSCTEALVTYASIRDMTIGTILSQFKDLVEYVA